MGLAEARRAWAEGRDLMAGELVCATLSPEERVRWAADLLEHVLEHIENMEPGRDVVRLARERDRWPDAHRMFSAVRQHTLRVEAEPDDAPRRSIRDCVLLLAEATAKLAWNATDNDAPFDADTGHWVPQILRHLIRHDPQLEEQLTALVLLG